MEKYIFTITGTLVKREIQITYINDFITDYESVGNIYNLIDYINNTSWNNSYLTFEGFTIKELSFIVKGITPYIDIITIAGPTTLIISSKKKKLRGKHYDKMDR